MWNKHSILTHKNIPQLWVFVKRKQICKYMCLLLVAVPFMCFNEVIYLDDAFHILKPHSDIDLQCVDLLEEGKGFSICQHGFFLYWCWEKMQTYIFRPCGLISLNNRALQNPNTLLCDIVGKGLTCPHKEGHHGATSDFWFLAK